MSAKTGDTVSVHYVGKLSDNSIFDSSEGRDPLSFTIGGEQVIKGFETAVIGMEIGDTKTVEIPANDAYGPYQEGLVAVIGREQLPSDIDPQIGRQLQVTGEKGEYIIMTITDVTDKNVTLDGNHSLAGKDLTFDISLVEIK